MKINPTLALAAATLATGLLTQIALHQPQSPAAKPAQEFGVFFYEPAKGFQDRTNQNAEKYWQSWTGYIGGVQQSGKMTGGSALTAPQEGISVDKSGTNKIDEKRVQLSGFVIITANNLEEALAVAKSSPAIAEGGRVEVRPVLPMTQHK